MGRVFDQVKSISIMDFTCLRSHEPNLFRLVNGLCRFEARGTSG